MFFETLKSLKSEVTQSCPTLCDPMDCSLLGSSIHGIFQARILEWVAISFSKRSSWPRDWTWVSYIVGRCFTVWATGDARYCSAAWETLERGRKRIRLKKKSFALFHQLFKTWVRKKGEAYWAFLFIQNQVLIKTEGSHHSLKALPDLESLLPSVLISHWNRREGIGHRL